MAKPTKPKAIPPIVPVFEESEIPKYQVGPVDKAKPTVPFIPIMEKVRALAGKSALILQHPNATQMVRNLKDAFPEFEIVTRTLRNDGKETTGVWARLKVAAPPIPESPSPNPLTAPDLG